MKKISRSLLRKRAVAKLDTLVSLYARLRAKLEYRNCPFCRAKPIQQCFHFITRAKYATRWDLMNVEGSCSGCNLRNEYDPHQFTAWFINQHGTGTFHDLVRRSNQIPKFSVEDLQDKIKSVQGLLETLCGKES